MNNYPPVPQTLDLPPMPAPYHPVTTDPIDDAMNALAALGIVPDIDWCEDFKMIAVLTNDYSAFDLADHLSDVMPETIGTRRLWDMNEWELTLLAAVKYPGGVDGLWFALEGI